MWNLLKSHNKKIKKSNTEKVENSLPGPGGDKVRKYGEKMLLVPDQSHTN